MCTLPRPAAAPPYNPDEGGGAPARGTHTQALNPKVKANTLTAGGEGVCWLDMDARAPPSGQEQPKGEELLHRSPSSKNRAELIVP